jgi:hypothetical protein
VESLLVLELSCWAIGDNQPDFNGGSVDFGDQPVEMGVVQRQSEVVGFGQIRSE